jgi:hypothetical protein
MDDFIESILWNWLCDIAMIYVTADLESGKSIHPTIIECIEARKKWILGYGIDFKTILSMQSKLRD